MIKERIEHEKTITSIFLVLALCLGLALLPAPAFAAGSDQHMYDIKIGISNDIAPPLMEFSSPLLNFKERKIGDPLVYDSQTTSFAPFPCYRLPLDTSITIGNLRHEGSSLLERLYFEAWSDPDGDGV